MPANFFPTDPDENAASLSNLAEVLFGCLDAIGARTVVEIGAFHGKSTERDARLGRARRRQVIAVDPAPQPDLREIAAAPPGARAGRGDQPRGAARPARRRRDHHRRRPQLLHAERGAAADRRAHPGREAAAADAARHRLAARPPRRLLRARADPGRAPPAARPRHLPRARRSRGPRPTGCRSPASPPARAGPRNGILTAVEDFLADHPELEFARVPAFFGFGVIWHPEAPWAADVAAAVAPWDQNPVLERLEANRVLHMVERYRMTRRLERAADRGERADAVLAALAGLAGPRRRRAALAPARPRPPRVHARAGAARAGRLRLARQPIPRPTRLAPLSSQPSVIDSAAAASHPPRRAQRLGHPPAEAVLAARSSCFQWATRSSSSSPPISRAAEASASARRARHSQSPSREPLWGSCSSHFSATCM